MDSETERDQAVRKLAELIGKIRIAMLTTLTEEGAFRSRPITTHGARFDGDLWFLTRVDSSKLEEVRQHRRVGLIYASKAEELWDPSYHAWLPRRAERFRSRLDRGTVELAEYWAAPALTWPLGGLRRHGPGSAG